VNLQVVVIVVTMTVGAIVELMVTKVYWLAKVVVVVIDLVVAAYCCDRFRHVSVRRCELEASQEQKWAMLVRLMWFSRSS
jgi:hypothetical protein